MSIALYCMNKIKIQQIRIFNKSFYKLKKLKYITFDDDDVTSRYFCRGKKIQCMEHSSHPPLHNNLPFCQHQ